MAIHYILPEYIVGPRYSIRDVTAGAGDTIKLEAGRGGWMQELSEQYPVIELPKPVAGPIIRVGSNPGDKPWYAICESCNNISKTYKRKNEPALYHWARTHRCPREGATGSALEGETGGWHPSVGGTPGG